MNLKQALRNYGNRSPTIVAGFAALVLSCGFAADALATTWGVTNIYSFAGGVSGPDAGNPYAGVILGTDGNFYGTTTFGESTTAQYSR